jgi:Kef-type K+ transport system membrane component KefB
MTLPITHPVLIVAIAMGIFLAAPLLAQRVRIPGLVGILLAGAVVGPNALNLLERTSTIVLLGTVGLLYLMFVAGMEIDLYGFRRYRAQSLVFGAFTFFVPQVLGTAVALLLGYGWAAAILIASMFASHTLLAYPIAIRLGIAKNRAVTTAVGGTIITDTAALLVLAVVAASTRGALDAAFWVRLVVLLTLYFAAVWYGLPRLGRWFFRRQGTSATGEFVFILTALFAGSYLAEVAGVEAIVGAFLVGLSLNRLIPEHSLLNNRLHFVGESIFIPFFLLSVGMLVDARVLAGDPRAWQVMIAMTATVTLTKWIAARAAQAVFGYSASEGRVVFGLSVAQAAATLAASLVGVEIGLLDEAVLNGVILMIVVTCVVSPLVVEKYGRRIALEEERRPFEPGAGPQRILVPIANPATAEGLLDLALVLRDPDSEEPIFPMTVVPAAEEQAEEHVALAERMLGHAVAYASGADVPVIPLTRVDHSFARGIARGIAETRTSTVIIGWDGKRVSRWGIFGSVLDQLLEQTKQQLLVARLGHPLNTTERIFVLVPPGADRVPGFLDGVRLLKRMANRLGAGIHGVCVATPAAPWEAHFTAVRPEAPVRFAAADDWPAALADLRAALRPDDLVVLVSARRGTVSWNAALERLPGDLARLVPESFIILHPAEAAPPTRRLASGEQLVRSLPPERVLVDAPPVPLPDLLRRLLGPAFADRPDRLRELVDRLAAPGEEAAPEIVPGVVVPHLRIRGLPRPLAFLAVRPRGGPAAGGDGPRLVFVLLSPEEDDREHLAHLAEIARLVSDPERVRRLAAAADYQELREILLDAAHAG